MDKYAKEIKQIIIDKSLDRDIEVNISKPPDYVCRYMPELKNEQIILLCKKKEEPRGTHHNTFLNESSLAGEPLEAPFADQCSIVEMCVKRDKLLFLPLNVDEMRMIINSLNGKIVYPVWAITDGEDSNKFTLLGYQSTKSRLKKIWAIIMSPEDKSTQELLDIHQEYTNSQHFDFKGTAIYKVKTTLLSSVTLTTNWSNFSIEPPKILDAVLTTTFTTNTMGITKFFMDQVIHLYALVQFVKSSKKNDFPIFNKVQNDSNHASNIKNVLNKYESKPRSELPSKNECFSNLINVYTSKESPFMNLADYLWYHFLDCQSLECMENCYHQLLIDVNKLHIIVPQAVNTSNIAALLSGQNRMASISFPIKDIIDIGIEKLRRDVLNIFKFVLSLVHSESFYTPAHRIGDGEWLETAENWITWLGKMNCVFQSLITSSTGIDCKGNLVTLAKAAIEQFAGTKSKINIPYLLNSQELEYTSSYNLEETITSISIPDELFLSFSTMEKGNILKTVFLKSLMNPFPHIRCDKKNIKQNHWSYLQLIDDVNCFAFTS